MKLNNKIHDNLIDFKHECLFVTDLKHVYFIIFMHLNDRKYFVFIISEIK